MLKSDKNYILGTAKLLEYYRILLYLVMRNVFLLLFFLLFFTFLQAQKYENDTIYSKNKEKSFKRCNFGIRIGMALDNRFFYNLTFEPFKNYSSMSFNTILNYKNWFIGRTFNSGKLFLIKNLNKEDFSINYILETGKITKYENFSYDCFLGYTFNFKKNISIEPRFIYSFGNYNLDFISDGKDGNVEYKNYRAGVGLTILKYLHLGKYNYLLPYINIGAIEQSFFIKAGVDYKVWLRKKI
jgi:hypothetical protein